MIFLGMTAVFLFVSLFPDTIPGPHDNRNIRRRLAFFDPSTTDPKDVATIPQSYTPPKQTFATKIIPVDGKKASTTNSGQTGEFESDHDAAVAVEFEMEAIQPKADAILADIEAKYGKPATNPPAGAAASTTVSEKTADGSQSESSNVASEYGTTTTAASATENGSGLGQKSADGAGTEAFANTETSGTKVSGSSSYATTATTENSQSLSETTKTSEGTPVSVNTGTSGTEVSESSTSSTRQKIFLEPLGADTVASKEPSYTRLCRELIKRDSEGDRTDIHEPFIVTENDAVCSTQESYAAIGTMLISSLIAQAGSNERIWYNHNCAASRSGKPITTVQQWFPDDLTFGTGIGQKPVIERCQKCLDDLQKSGRIMLECMGFPNPGHLVEPTDPMTHAFRMAGFRHNLQRAAHNFQQHELQMTAATATHEQRRKLSETSDTATTSQKKSESTADESKSVANGTGTEGESNNAATQIKDYKTTASGLKYKITRQGSGAKPSAGDNVKTEYTGWLDDFQSNKKFDSSRDRGVSFWFHVGAGEVIKGWDEAFLDMQVGERRNIIIPPSLGYGDRGAGSRIPGGATLYFDVELLAIQGAGTSTSIREKSVSTTDESKSAPESTESSSSTATSGEPSSPTTVSSEPSKPNTTAVEGQSTNIATEGEASDTSKSEVVSENVTASTAALETSSSSQGTASDSTITGQSVLETSDKSSTESTQETPVSTTGAQETSTTANTSSQASNKAISKIIDHKTYGGAVIVLDTEMEADPAKDKSWIIPFYVYKDFLTNTTLTGGILNDDKITPSSIAVLVMQRCIDSNSLCKTHGQELVKRLKSLFPQSVVSGEIVQSTASLYGRIMDAPLLFCPTPTMTCLLPSLMREYSKTTIVMQDLDLYGWYRYSLRESKKILHAPVILHDPQPPVPKTPLTSGASLEQTVSSLLDITKEGAS